MSTTTFQKRSEFIDGMQFEIKGLIVLWCYLGTPDTRFEHVYKVGFKLTDTAAENMKAAGFNVKSSKDFDKFKEGDDVFFYMEAKNKLKTKAGEDIKWAKPHCKGRDGKTDVDADLIGPGSKINMKVFAKYSEVKGKLHLPLRVNSVQIDTLVEATGHGCFDSLESADEEAEREAREAEENSGDGTFAPIA